MCICIPMHRLRAVSLFLENPWERTQNKYACERDCERDVGATMPRTASNVDVGTLGDEQSQSCSHAYLFCVLSHGLIIEERETARSLLILL